MRISGGSAAGRRLFAPAGRATRPTPARVREALFSMLHSRGQAWAAEDHVLDLFAGSGAVGLECLSRGAPRATFVERGPEALSCLRRNIAGLGWQGRAEVRAASAAAALAALTGPFALVFVDPPYAGPPLQPVLAMLGQRGLVAPGGWVICEHATGALAPSPPAGLAPVTRRAWGAVSLSFFVADA